MASVAAHQMGELEKRTSSGYLCGDRKRSLSRPRDWSEDELVRRMIAGEQAAWREFVSRYEPLVRSLVWRVLSRFSAVAGRGESDDIYAEFLQSLLLRDMHKLRCFDSGRGSSLGSWVGMLATNAAWDHLRRVSRHTRGAKELVHQAEPRVVADPLVCLVAKQSAHTVDRTLKQMSTKDQAFVELFYVVGMPAEDIAAEMNISIKTVYSKKHKINMRLQRAL